MPPFFFFFPILVVSCFKSHPKEKKIIFFLNNLCYVGHMLKFVFNVDKSPCNFKITSQIQNVRTQMVFNETKNQEPMHLSAMVEATSVRFNYHNRQRNTGPPCYYSVCRSWETTAFNPFSSTHKYGHKWRQGRVRW